MKDYSDAVKRYESGASIQEIADSYSVTRQAMWKILLRRGVTMRPQLRFGNQNHFHRGQRLHEKRTAHLVEIAIGNGTLIPQKCETCGEKAVGHHDDYNKPLDVRWLCKKHHFEWHSFNQPVPLSTQLPKKNQKEIASMGGKASAAKLSPEQRSARTRHALKSRWP